MRSDGKDARRGSRSASEAQLHGMKQVRRVRDELIHTFRRLLIAAVMPHPLHSQLSRSRQFYTIFKESKASASLNEALESGYDSFD